MGRAWSFYNHFNPRNRPNSVEGRSASFSLGAGIVKTFRVVSSSRPPGIIIQAHGQGSVAGRREDQCISPYRKQGLTNGFNHYLTHGAEFDQHVAYTLLGAEGNALLATDGEATIVRVAVPGQLALDAAHPFFSIDEMRVRGEVPNLVGDILTAWSYRLARPGFQSRTLKVDCGMIFRSAVSADWILDVERLPKC